jgi:hypothetical protein
MDKPFIVKIADAQATARPGQAIAVPDEAYPDWRNEARTEVTNPCPLT